MRNPDRLLFSGSALVGGQAGGLQKGTAPTGKPFDCNGLNPKRQILTGTRQTADRAS